MPPILRSPRSVGRPRPALVRLLLLLCLAVLTGLIGAAMTGPGADHAVRDWAGQGHSFMPAVLWQDEAPGRHGDGSLGPADGEVREGTTVFDDVPALTRLDGGLLAALRRAGAEAASDGVALQVNSGWRSKRYQQRLFDDAVATYGSATVAARWVARPGTSIHEAGAAVDIGPAAAASWLGQHGAAYGLCQVYANEPWHFELRPRAARSGCPATYADAAHDPRMR